jgi:hypothetical protein
VNKGLSDIGMGSTTWGFRFNAPGKVEQECQIIPSHPLKPLYIPCLSSRCNKLWRRRFPLGACLPLFRQLVLAKRHRCDDGL